MPLTKCPECGHEMSSSAPACPNCGWQPIPAQPAPDKVVYVADAPEEKSGCSLSTIIIGLLVGLGIFALLVFLFYPYAEQPPASNTVNVNLTIEAQNKQTTEIIITTPEPRETPPPPTPRPTEPPPTPRPTAEKPTPPPKPQSGSNSRSNGNK
jgi:hypothetical protein